MYTFEKFLLKVRKFKLGIKTITCKNCGWTWNLKNGGKDPYICHKCGYNNE